MSQLERVNVSVDMVDGDRVKITYNIVKSKPKLPIRASKAVGSDAGEFIITRDTKGVIVSVVMR